MSESQRSNVKTEGEDTTDSEPSRKRDDSHLSLDEVIEGEGSVMFLTEELG